MKILVTGGAGFIGSHLVESLVAQGHTVFVLDDLNDFYSPDIKRQNLASVASQITFIEEDLRNGEAIRSLFEKHSFDVVIHLAARAGVRPSLLQPHLYVETNVIGTLNLLEAAKQTGVKRMVFASSSSVYGTCTTVPFHEKLPLLQTISPYAATKLAGEQLCSNYVAVHGMRIIALRFFTVYGPRQRPDLAIHRFTDRIHNGLPIEQFGNGSTRRDYTYIDDIIQGILGAVRYACASEKPEFEICNLGESQTISLSRLIALIEKVLNKTAKIHYLPEQAGDVPQTYADISRAAELLDYQPKTSIEEGIPRFVEWYLNSRR